MTFDDTILDIGRKAVISHMESKGAEFVAAVEDTELFKMRYRDEDKTYCLQQDFGSEPRLWRGSILIEQMHDFNREEAGIRTTKADVYLYLSWHHRKEGKRELIAIETDSLKSLIKELYFLHLIEEKMIRDKTYYVIPKDTAQHRFKTAWIDFK